MKRSIFILGCALALLAGSTAASGQGTDEQKAFQDAAGDRSVLFRGKEAMHYDFAANGHPYWSTREFIPGEIVVDGCRYHDVPLNIDAFTQQALVKMSNQVIAVALDPDQVVEMQIGDHRYEGVGPGHEDIPEGIYEVLGTGPEQVLKRVSKSLANSMMNVNGAQIGYEDPNYRSQVYVYFAYKATYYFRDREGRCSALRNKSALLRHFPGRKQELRRAVRNWDASADVVYREILQAVNP